MKYDQNDKGHHNKANQYEIYIETMRMSKQDSFDRKKNLLEL